MPNQCDACGADNLEVDVKCTACGKPLLSTGVYRMVGSTVLEYEIVDVLGQGGMSVVYHARHLVTHQEVALKVLPRELAAHSQVRSRFLEEARALAQLDHANIVHLYQFGEADGCFVLAMQYVPGTTFERIILERRRVSWRDAVRVGIDVARALEYAHARGVVHRDMKPSNVLVRRDTGEATVMDFGIAKMATSTKLTATGQTMGTVRYMSPEQVRGHEVDLRTDLYSLGVTLYEAVVGDTPFDGETHFEIMTKHLNAPPPPPSSLGVQLPAALEHVILACLAKRRDDRFASAGALREALEAARDGREPVLPGAELPIAAGDAGDVDRTAVVPRDRRRPGMWLALGLAVLAAGAAVFALSRAPEQGPASPRIAASAAAPVLAADAAAIGTPAPYLFADVIPAVDRSFDELRLRVLAVRERDVEPVAAAIARARTQFLALLAARVGAPVELARRGLNVVLVPAAMICDRRLYRNDRGFEGCEARESHYRPRERTLYIADNERLLDVNLPSEIAMQTCLDLDSSVQATCADAFSEFERGLSRRR